MSEEEQIDGKLSRRKFIVRGAMSGFALWSGYAFGFEPEWIEHSRIDIPIRGLPKEFEGYKIALFSDIHYPRNISADYVRRVCSHAMDFKPDLIAIPGDFCDGKFIKSAPSLKGLLDTLHAPDGVVGTLGNHDHWLDGQGVRKEILENTPVKLIDNSGFVLSRGESSLAIGGIGDLWEGAPDVVEAFRGVDPSVPRILLSHNPDFAEEMVADVRVDLQLSGHTHGGEFRFPFGPAPVVPSRYGQKYREGLVQGKSHRVYVSRGICSPRHLRFLSRPEVTTIVLRGATNGFA